MNLGVFDLVIPIGRGSSTPGGLENNKRCKICNLYPVSSLYADSDQISKPEKSDIVKLKLEATSTFKLLKELIKSDGGDFEIGEHLAELISKVVEKDDTEKADADVLAKEQELANLEAFGGEVVEEFDGN